MLSRKPLVVNLPSNSEFWYESVEGGPDGKVRREISENKHEPRPERLARCRPPFVPWDHSVPEVRPIPSTLVTWFRIVCVDADIHYGLAHDEEVVVESAVVRALFRLLVVRP